MFCLVVAMSAMSDLVYDAEAIHDHCKLLTASGNLFWNMSDARETAYCNFTGITHISERISRKGNIAYTSCTMSYIATRFQEKQFNFQKYEKNTTKTVLRCIPRMCDPDQNVETIFRKLLTTSGNLF